MTDTIVMTGIYLVVVVQLALQAGIIFSAYRVVKLTGSFRAWTMIIAAFLLGAVSGLMGIFILLSNPDQITSIVQSFGASTIFLSDALSIATSLLLFFGMFDLRKRFEHAAKKP